METMGRRPVKTIVLDMPFLDALERFIRVDPKEVPAQAKRPAAPKPAKKSKNRSPSKAPNQGRKQPRSKPRKGRKT
jgi:hypothetical protein